MEDNQIEKDHTKDAEEPLGIVTEVATVKFLVTFTDYLLLINKGV